MTRSAAASAPTLPVYVTVDVELWPVSWEGYREQFRDSYDRYILGRTSRGEAGLPFQLRMAEEHGLRFVFFVESLFALEFGLSPLEDIVHRIREAGQEVQLHAHPEWVRHASKPILETGERYVFHEFGADEQLRLVRAGLDTLKEAGAKDVSAFRAGSFAANADTLDAVAAAGLEVDSSFKLGARVEGDSGTVIDGCLSIDGVTEHPLSTYEDWPGHRRHLQFSACSTSELKHVLEEARHAGWTSAVILSHSVELLNGDRSRPDPIVMRRFEKFCRFLADRRDQLPTAGFCDEEAARGREAPFPPVRSTRGRTALRMGEQLLRRLVA